MDLDLASELTLDLALDLALDLVPLLALDPSISDLRISYLRYTGFKGVSIASDNLSLRRPRIGYARLLVARNVPNYSTIPDSRSVIRLGHKVNVPLIRPSSELGDGFEPHVHI